MSTDGGQRIGFSSLDGSSVLKIGREKLVAGLRCMSDWQDDLK